MLEIKDDIKLDRTIFGDFDRCFQANANEVLARHNFFLKFIERQNMFRFLIQKKVQRKNRGTRNLSSSVFRVFDGYDMIRPQLAHKERIEVAPIKIVYEPSCDEKTPVSCFFTYQIHIAY